MRRLPATALAAQRVAMRTASGVTYLHGDHLGSTSVTTNDTGGNPKWQTYYAYGTVRTTSGTLPTDYSFTGQKLDASSGLMYYGARYYDAAIGRFAQPDSIVPNPYNPQDLNRYSYARNNPLRYRDPSGHCPICAAALAYGGAVVVNTAVDTGIDYVIAQITGDKFNLSDSLKTNLVIDAVTAGVGGKIAKSTKVASLAEKLFAQHGDDLAKGAAKLIGAHPGLGKEAVEQGVKEGVKKWTQKELREIAKESIMVTGDKKVLLLGNFDDVAESYIAAAKKEGGAFFQLPGKYDSLPDPIKQQINMLALEIAHEEGYAFKVGEQSWKPTWKQTGLFDEIEYIREQWGIDLSPE